MCVVCKMWLYVLIDAHMCLFVLCCVDGAIFGHYIWLDDIPFSINSCLLKFSGAEIRI